MREDKHVKMSVSISTFHMWNTLLLDGPVAAVLPLNGAVLTKPFALLQQEGVVLALASRHCPALLALPEMYPGGLAQQFWFPAP